MFVLFQIFDFVKKLLLKSSGEKVDEEKRTDLLFQALDKLKEAEIMVSQHILSDTDTHTDTDTFFV
jgi:hypothetical protein